jgi:hypothetical protein
MVGTTLSLIKSTADRLQVLTGILRHYAMILLQTAPKKQDLPKIRQQRALVRGINLRANANVLSPASFQARKSYMVSAFQEGKFLAEPEARGKPRPNPMSDPAAMEGMMGMMKGNMAMMIPQTLIMGWINAFFSGFVISKLRIFLPLPDGFAKCGWIHSAEHTAKPRPRPQASVQVVLKSDAQGSPLTPVRFLSLTIAAQQ